MRAAFILLVALAATASATSSEQAITNYAEAVLRSKLFPGFRAQALPSRDGVPPVVQTAAEDCANALTNEMQSSLSGGDCAELLQASNGFDNSGSSGSNSAPPTQAQLTNQLNALCSTKCYPVYLDVVRSYGRCMQVASSGTGGGFSFDIYGMLTRVVEFMCTKNLRGEFCLVQMYDSRMTNTSARNSLTPNGDLCQFYSDYGCCTASLIQTYDQSLSVWSNVFTTCALSQVPACPVPNVAYQVLLVKVRIQGVVYTWVAQSDANRRIAEASLKRDLARLFNVPAGYIVISSMSSGSLIAELNVRGANDTVTASVRPAVASALSSSSATFTSLDTALPAEAKSGSLSIDTSASSVTATTQINQVGAAFARAALSWALVAALACFAHLVMA